MYVILNPHISDFIAEPLSSRLFRRRPLKKYAYLITEAIKDGSSIEVLMDSSASGIIPMGIYKKLPGLLRKLITRIEGGIWKRINAYDDRVKIIYHSANAASRAHLVTMCYKNYQNAESSLKTIDEFDHVVIHISHYHLNTTAQSLFLSRIKNLTIASDADLSATPYFKSKFPWYSEPVFILPYEVTERFKATKLMAERTPDAMATGTFHFFDKMQEKGDTSTIEFCEANHTNTLHPVRRMLYEQQEAVKDLIETRIAPYNDDTATSPLKKLLSTTFSSQKTYFAFDIVAAYNAHRFAVIGEEFYSGVAGVGSFEAMACGAVLIGHPACYHGLGMIAGKHYLPHDNSLENILSTIKQYGGDDAILTPISEAGKMLAQEFFRPSSSYKRLLSYLKGKV